KIAPISSSPSGKRFADSIHRQARYAGSQKVRWEGISLAAPSPSAKTGLRSLADFRELSGQSFAAAEKGTAAAKHFSGKAPRQKATCPFRSSTRACSTG